MEKLSDNLINAVRHLVEEKRHIDKLGAKGFKWIAGDLYDCGPYIGQDFFEMVFPFVYSGRDVNRADWHYLRVPTDLVIGCSWAWRPEDLTEDQILLKIAAYNSDSYETGAEYYLIKSLGFYIAHEGKNRVELFQQRAIKTIPAKVKESNYPPAELINIHKLIINGQTKYLAVYNEEFIQRLEYPELVLPVLKEYGVSIYNKWPQNYPHIDLIDAALARPKEDVKFARCIVSLTEIAENENKLVNQAVYSLPIENKFTIVFFTFVAMFLSLFLMRFFEKQSFFGELFQGVWHTSIAIIFLIFIPIFKVKKSLVSRSNDY